MYEDSEQLEQYRPVWLTEKTHKLLKAEKERLKKEHGRDLSMAKILNNLIIQIYGLTR